MSLASEKYYKTDAFTFQNDPGFFLEGRLMMPQNVTVSHRHEFTECIFITGGHGAHQCKKNEEVPISRGDILIIPPGGVHAYTQADDDLFLINIIFDTNHLPPILLDLYTKKSYKKLFLKDVSRYEKADFPLLHPDPERFDELELYARHLAECSGTPGNHCRKLGLFMVLLSLLTDAVEHITGEEAGIPVLDLQKLTAYMRNNFQRPVYLDELARLASVSNATLMRHFRAACGCTPMEYLLNLRLHHAAELLINSSLSVKEISDMSGFPAQSYFFRAFKNNYGIPPAAFRGRNKKHNSKSE